MSLPAAITFHPIVASDEEFLCRLYASTREEELAQVPWSHEEKDAFLRMQFTAQHAYYQEHYADADFRLILREGIPIGRLYLARWPEEIRIVDIALLPEHRGGGLGTALLQGILAEADMAGKPVRIHVEIFNPAHRLYQRLGFTQIADRGVYLFLERPPTPQVKTAS
ncbi:MAG: GNAT family N-acetyltransferase [Gemmatimonadetes bacterium]|nr:GNAT family N-acetyltransferase [Gemmatimonadota bacterium]